MDPKQAKKILRYGDGINIVNAIKDKLGEYVEIKVYAYIQENFIDYIWIVFKEEFKGFTTKDFRYMRINIRAKLRTYLLKRGVYIGRHNNRYLILEVLFDLL